MKYSSNNKKKIINKTTFLHTFKSSTRSNIKNIWKHFFCLRRKGKKENWVIFLDRENLIKLKKQENNDDDNIEDQSA